MTTQEMIFDYLKVQGLVPEYDEDKDIRFKYQMRNFVVSNYPDDRQFLQIMMPFIFDVTAENRVSGARSLQQDQPVEEDRQGRRDGRRRFSDDRGAAGRDARTFRDGSRMLDMLVGAQQSFYDTLREM